MLNSATAVAAVLAGGALAQDVGVISPDEVEIIGPGADEVGGEAATRNVDVVRPQGVVRAELGERGEAPVVSGENLVELDEDFVDISAFTIEGDHLIINMLEDQARALPVCRGD